MSEFTVGSVVTHRKHDFDMAIESILDGVAYCVWFEGSDAKRAKYPLSSLVKVRD